MLDFRRAKPEDIQSAYNVFRRSIFAYIRKIGLATDEEAADPPVESAWRRQRDWVTHFWNTAAENWVAVGENGAVVGWALSVERSGHLELVFFFVDPNHSARGAGSRLLELSFSSRPEKYKSIMATQDPAAVSLYLRTGVRFISTSCDVCIVSRPKILSTDLWIRRIEHHSSDIAIIATIEERILSLRRDVDLTHLAECRPGWIAMRGGSPVGYAFGAQPVPQGATDFPPTCGPVAALEATDLPALLDHVLDAAPADTQLYFTVPLNNSIALGHLLKLGGKIDPFYIAILSNSKNMLLDRYVHTSPSFIV